MASGLLFSTNTDTSGMPTLIFLSNSLRLAKRRLALGLEVREEDEAAAAATQTGGALVAVAEHEANLINLARTEERPGEEIAIDLKDLFKTTDY